MKKGFFTLLATALIAVLPLSARNVSESAPAPKQETKEYRLNGFTGLNVSWVYQVELTQSLRYSVRVEAPDDLMPYLEVEVRGENLILGVDDSVPRDIRRRIENPGRNTIRAYVSMPDLYELKMSGASRLQAQGEFASRKPFELSLSGAVNVSNLSVRAASADIVASGAAKLYLTGKYDKMSARLSGSVNATLDVDAKTVDIQSSGAANLALNGKYNELSLRGSGAANTDLDGSVDTLEATGSGAAVLDARQTPIRRARISFSGAANATISVQDELSVTLSGASKLKYHPGPHLHITDQSVSRASTLSSF